MIVTCESERSIDAQDIQFTDFIFSILICNLEMLASAFIQIEAVRVKHSQHPHGVVIEHEDGWKLVYSGDCRPSLNLVEAGNLDLNRLFNIMNSG